MHMLAGARAAAAASRARTPSARRDAGHALVYFRLTQRGAQHTAVRRSSLHRALPPVVHVGRWPRGGEARARVRVRKRDAFARGD